MEEVHSTFFCPTFLPFKKARGVTASLKQAFPSSSLSEDTHPCMHGCGSTIRIHITRARA